MFVRKNMDWTGMMETAWNTQQTPGTSKLEARRHPGLWTQPMIEFPRGARLVRKTQRTETIFEGDTTKSSHSWILVVVAKLLGLAFKC